MRQSFGGDTAKVLGADSQNVWLISDAIRIDVETLHRLVIENGKSPVDAALALCRGELMEGFFLREAAFNDWLAAERTVVRRLQVEILVELAEACLRRDDDDDDSALALAERLVSIDPLNEEAHRLLMRVHERAGRRNAALAQYQACKDVLARELNVEPDAATRKLFESLKATEDGNVAPAGVEADEAIGKAGPVETTVYCGSCLHQLQR